MSQSKYPKAGHNPKLVALLYFVRSTPRDRNGKPVAEVVETNATGFMHLFLN